MYRLGLENTPAFKEEERLLAEGFPNLNSDCQNTWDVAGRFLLP